MLKPTKILVPTDFSEYSHRALKQALDIAKQYDAKVFLLHVVRDEIQVMNMDFVIPGETLQQMSESKLAWAKESLQKEIDEFPESKEVEIITNVRQGVPYEEILKEGKEQGIDLIVIASLGRAGIARYLIGSVSRNVLKGSACPVLLTK
ncbi:MAG: universal stress protein [Syntrophorhabdus sp.]|jgi:nucleotide-binding universal stress UspA family protein